jgi:phosphonate transport system ATP-binding protein
MPLGGAPAAVPALKVTGLRKQFDGAGSAVWSGISFEVPQGQRLAIIGGNGAGKSTLLRCCMGLLDVQAGDVQLSGHGVTGLKGRALALARARVGFVFQKHNLVPRLSVLTNVLHGGLARSSTPRLWYQGWASDAHRQEAMACLGQVGMAHLARQRADALSGGQSQRVAIARALMQQPETIFADEPVASLDPQAGEDVMQVFSDLSRRQGLTLVFVTHHLEHAVRYADRVIGLQGGSLALDAPAPTLPVQQLRSMYG